MRLVSLRSSMLSNIGFDPNSEVLVVQFANGDFYRYEGVPAETYIKLLTDKTSHGQSFLRNVRAKAFPYKKIEREDVEGL